MANTQIGSVHGVNQVGPVDAKLAEITADGANQCGVAAGDLHKFQEGQKVAFRIKATGAIFGATIRTCTGIIWIGNAFTYDGADLTLVPGTHAVYDGDAATAAQSTVASNRPQGINGGSSSRRGYTDEDLNTIQGMRDALSVYLPGTYTSAYLDAMTYNDMVFAVRNLRTPVGVRGY